MRSKIRLRVIIFVAALFVTTQLFAQCDLSGWRLFIDPGHGGSDPGAIGPTGLREKDVTLDTALQLRDWLESIGATVGMSRITDVFVALSTRADRANQFGADRFVSIHYNGFSNPSVNGTEVFVVPNPRPVTRDLGQKLLDYIVSYIGLPNRGLKFANFTVLVRTSMPAALSESSFITNPDEEQRLYDPSYRGLIGSAHADGLCDHLGGFFGASSREPISIAEREPAQLTMRKIVEADAPDQLKPVYIIEGNRNFMAPRFSPDGNYLAFTQFGYEGIFVADLLHAGAEQLTNQASAGLRLSWSADGNWIAYASRDRKGSSISIVNVKTKETSAVISGLNYLVYPEFQPNGDLLVVPENIKEFAPARFNFSKNGESRSSILIPYVDSANGQVSLEFDGELRQLTDDKGVLYTNVVANPNKSKLLLTANDPDASRLVILDVEKQKQYDLSFWGVGRQDGFNLGYDGTWAPDGAEVLFAFTKDNGYSYLESDLFVTDGNKVRQLTFDGVVKTNPNWSVRNQIAYNDATGRIIVADLKE